MWASDGSSYPQPGYCLSIKPGSFLMVATSATRGWPGSSSSPLLAFSPRSSDAGQVWLSPGRDYPSKIAQRQLSTTYCPSGVDRVPERPESRPAAIRRKSGRSQIAQLQTWVAHRSVGAGVPLAGIPPSTSNLRAAYPRKVGCWRHTVSGRPMKPHRYHSPI